MLFNNCSVAVRLCLLALNTPYQHSCQGWSVQHLKLVRGLLGSSLSAQESGQQAVSHDGARSQALYLSVCFPVLRGARPFHLASHMRGSLLPRRNEAIDAYRLGCLQQ